MVRDVVMKVRNIQWCEIVRKREREREREREG